MSLSYKRLQRLHRFPEDFTFLDLTEKNEEILFADSNEAWRYSLFEELVGKLEIADELSFVIKNTALGAERGFLFYSAGST